MSSRSSCDGPDAASGCCGPAGAIRFESKLARRDFLATVGGAAGLVLAGWRPLRAMAGPFAPTQDGGFPIPFDKKLDAAWVRSLLERGSPTVYRLAAGELGKIGMPIGGLCAGQLYLGGDGKLWHWDVFNRPAPQEWHDSSGYHYAKPPQPAAPLEQGFALRVSWRDATGNSRSATRFLDARGFGEIEFRGEYPIGRVSYRDPALPVSVLLEAFSPFIPLDVESSGLPATILNYTVRNDSSLPATVELAGWLENATLLGGAPPGFFARRNHVERAPELTLLHCTVETVARDRPPREDVLFEDFERDDYSGWTVSGTAFGDRPMRRSEMPEYQGDVNAHGERLVNSHNARQGEDVAQADAHVGRMRSREFAIERDFIGFRIGGGNHPGQTCMNLLVDGAVVRSATGHDGNRMRSDSFDVRELAGRRAQLEIVDEVAGGWGNIGIDEIVFTDVPRPEEIDLGQRSDAGSLALALVSPDSTPGAPDSIVASATVDSSALPESAFAANAGSSATRPVEPRLDSPLVGALSRRFEIAPGAQATWAFVLAWHFPGSWWEAFDYLPDPRALRRHYGRRFASAADVARQVALQFDSLSTSTRLWHSTWYDSTLPYWFLDRTLLNVSILATNTCYRFADGRFYGFEGNYCCPGTCTHVWQYAQAVARLFPAFERDLRERVDFGLAFHEDGRIDYRGEVGREVAIDGHCGNVLRTWREHLMSADDGFLRRVWPRARRALEHLMSHDADEDGLLDGPQYNTLDTAWYGAIAWTSSLYVAALRAGDAMASEMGDAGFAARCLTLAERGSENLVKQLFNGEYFIHRPDPKHPEANSTGDGCHIDQLFGQSWALQVGLPRVVPIEQARSALNSLWKYNFAPDVGPYRKRMEEVLKGGRWYAMPGEAGLLMCTWPKGGAESATGKGQDAWAAGYFNECMSGFEYQVAAHMLWEGLVEQGLAITRAIHDRYHAARRNPWNEIECGDHYARAMASYGVFLAACGFECHGPKGHLGFAPRVTPEDFRAAFTAPEGWGTYSQQRDRATMRARLDLKHGSLRVNSIALEPTDDMRTAQASAIWIDAAVKRSNVPCRFAVVGARVTIRFDASIVLHAGESLEMELA